MTHYDIIRSLTSADEKDIIPSYDGFLSYGYFIKNQNIVFKFRKHPDVSYKNEAFLLDFLGKESFPIKLQSVFYAPEDDSFLALRAVEGTSLEHISLSDEEKSRIGEHLGKFLLQLHALKPETENFCPLDAEIGAWQERYESSKTILSEYFTEAEISRLDDFAFKEAPEILDSLGADYVFSHADLGEGNIFYDEKGGIGVIDFNESCYIDRAADFMDIEDDVITASVLDAYNADSVLRKKVKIRRLIRPLFVIGTYSSRGREAVEKYIQKIRTSLL